MLWREQCSAFVVHLPAAAVSSLLCVLALCLRCCDQVRSQRREVRGSPTGHGIPAYCRVEPTALPVGIVADRHIMIGSSICCCGSVQQRVRPAERLFSAAQTFGVDERQYGCEGRAARRGSADRYHLAIDDDLEAHADGRHIRKAATCSVEVRAWHFASRKEPIHTLNASTHHQCVSAAADEIRDRCGFEQKCGRRRAFVRHSPASGNSALESASRTRRN